MYTEAWGRHDPKDYPVETDFDDILTIDYPIDGGCPICYDQCSCQDYVGEKK